MSADHICTEKTHISDIKDTIDDVKALLDEVRKEQRVMHKKLFESNGERALVEIIRENTEWRTKMDAMFKKAVAGMIALVLGGHGLDKLASYLLK